MSTRQRSATSGWRASRHKARRREARCTPYYVAPERLNNEREDFRSDIYSLGATLFHAIAGKAPIEGETNSAVALRELKNRPLDLRKIVPEVSEATARVFHRVIAPEPARRFSSYDELVAELEGAERALKGVDDVDLARGVRRRRFFIGAALLVALLAAAAFFFARQAQERARSNAAVSIPLPELERQYNDVRRQLIAGKHNVARAAFARLAIDAKNNQPLCDWARMHQGLAALIRREASEAQTAFREVESAGQTGFAREDVDLAKFFVATAKTLSAPGIVPASAGSGENSNGAGAFALLLFALKDVNQADCNDAVPLLERFANAQPAGNFAWIGEYKPLAQKYLGDCHLYLAWKNEGKKTGAASLPATLENLRALKKKLKTHSAISEEVSAEEKSFTRLLAGQPEGVSSNNAEKRKKIGVSWDAALASYKERIALYDFVAAGAAIKDAQITDPSLKKSQAAMLKRTQWLIDWKNKLIVDLNRAHFSGSIADIDGGQYTGIVGADPEQLMLKTRYGIVGLPWMKLQPKMLLAMSASFIWPEAPDAVDRQWLCAVFASETGQTHAARQFAETAAKAKPEYREQISLLLSPVSPSG